MRLARTDTTARRARGVCQELLAPLALPAREDPEVLLELTARLERKGRVASRATTVLAALSALRVLWALVVSSAPEGTPVLLELLAPRACVGPRVLKASKATRVTEELLDLLVLSVPLALGAHEVSQDQRAALDGRALAARLELRARAAASAPEDTPASRATTAARADRVRVCRCGCSAAARCCC